MAGATRVFVSESVVDRDRRERELVHTQPHGSVVGQEARNAFFGNREDADLDIRGIFLSKHLVVPLDLIDGEGDLLLGFVSDDRLDLGRLDRGELGKACKGHVPGNGNDHR